MGQQQCSASYTGGGGGGGGAVHTFRVQGLKVTVSGRSVLKTSGLQVGAQVAQGFLDFHSGASRFFTPLEVDVLQHLKPSAQSQGFATPRGAVVEEIYSLEDKK